MLDIIHGAVKEDKAHAIKIVIEIIKKLESEPGENLFSDKDIFFSGYPLLDSPEGTVTLDALLLSQKYGIIAFDIVCDAVDSIEKISEKQDFIYNQLYSKFMKYTNLTKGRKLVFEINTISLDLFTKFKGDSVTGVTIASDEAGIRDFISGLENLDIDHGLLVNIKSVLQGVSRLKPLNKRTKVQKPDSKGWKLKKIEKQVANLDVFQNKAIIETTKGPQRITGLAGTGKTIVLAGKAAYLHALDSTLKIVITFYSRSLYQQYKDLVRRLYFEHASDEPDWNKVQLLHAWGSKAVPGLYSEIAKHNGTDPYAFDEARRQFGKSNVFENCCDDLLRQLVSPEEMYDAILIDEAQDMPRSFFEMCYLSTSEPHRVIWAYDELQQISKIELVPPPEILFGKDVEKKPRYKFRDSEEGPDDNIVLKVCYRNPKEIITTAHALGLAIYSTDGPIQMIEDRDAWQRIGYEVKGDLLPNKKVNIERTIDASPAFLSEYLSNTDIVVCKRFSDEKEQADWIATEIEKNINDEELEHTDILVICPEAYTLKSETGVLRATLSEKGINNHLAGATDASEYFMKNSIAISHIHRAKGNEAAVVYVMNAETCAAGTELIKKRNMLFTAITRAKSWVRICGIGERMTVIENEIKEICKNQYKLSFVFPSDLEKRRKLHREFTETEGEKKRKHLNKVLELKKALEKGEIHKGDMDENTLQTLRDLLGE